MCPSCPASMVGRWGASPGITLSPICSGCRCSRCRFRGRGPCWPWAPGGAVYTEGGDRHVVTKGAAAKKTKQLINCQRIYPPVTRNRQEILAAAAPVVQQPPKTYH